MRAKIQITISNVVNIPHERQGERVTGNNYNSYPY